MRNQSSKLKIAGYAFMVLQILGMCGNSLRQGGSIWDPTFFCEWNSFYNVIINISFLFGYFLFAILGIICLCAANFKNERITKLQVYMKESKEWSCPNCGIPNVGITECLNCGCVPEFHFINGQTDGLVEELSKVVRLPVTTTKSDEWTCPRCSMTNLGRFQCERCGLLPEFIEET